MHGEGARNEGCEQQHVVAQRHVSGDGVERRQQHTLQQQVIGIRQRASGGMKDVGVEDRAAYQRHRIVQHGVHAPSERPEIEERIAGPDRRADEGGRVQDEWPRHDRRCHDIDQQRTNRPRHRLTMPQYRWVSHPISYIST